MLAFHVPEFRIEPLSRPELRKDPILDRWVIISTDRLGRPVEFVEDGPAQPLARCPFCRGNEALTPPPTYVSPNEESWLVRVVPNTYPAVRDGTGRVAAATGLFQNAEAAGLHEVIIACPQHEANLSRLPPLHLAELFLAFQARLRQLGMLGPTQFPVIFNNQGPAAGASLEHAHAQLISSPIPPSLMAREWQAGERYYQATKRCVFCDLIEAERSQGERVVEESERFIVLSAYAARFPAECWILPKRHQSHFERIDPSWVPELGEVFGRFLRRLDRGLRHPPFNFYLHASPPFQAERHDYHWHLEILPRLTGIAGFEWAADMNINPVPPEQAAAYLRSIEV